MYARRAWSFFAEQGHQRSRDNGNVMVKFCSGRSAGSQYLGFILHETRGTSFAEESLATASGKAMWALGKSS
jgi:hypothetical protein